MWHQNNQEGESGHIATTPVLLQHQHHSPSLKYTTHSGGPVSYTDTKTHPHRQTYCAQLSHQAI